MRKRIVFISCSSSKLARRAKAENLYTGALFKLSLRYARQLRPDCIYILSAKHGLVELDQNLAPYNRTLGNMSEGQIRSWALKVKHQLAHRMDFTNCEAIFLAGENYRKYLVPCFIRHRIPLKELRIGEQLKALKRKTNVS